MIVPESGEVLTHHHHMCKKTALKYSLEDQGYVIQVQTLRSRTKRGLQTWIKHLKITRACIWRLIYSRVTRLGLMCFLPLSLTHATTRQGHTNSTKIYVWNASNRRFEPQATRDETSLSRRVRISPIWNMLSRLKGTSVHNMIDPQHAWAQSDARWHDNPKWASNARALTK